MNIFTEHRGDRYGEDEKPVCRGALQVSIEGAPGTFDNVQLALVSTYLLIYERGSTRTVKTRLQLYLAQLNLFEKDGVPGFTITTGDGIQKTFRTPSRSDYNTWTTNLKKVCVQPFQKDRFRYVQLLATAKQGEVWLLKDSDGTEVAAKFVRKEHLRNSIYAQLLENEIKTMNVLRHEKIVRLLGLYGDERNIILVMDYMRGGNLLQALRSKKFYTEQQASHVLRQLLEALEYLHSQEVIHRDVKLENIFLPEMNNATRVVLGDFDMSCFILDADPTKRCGTPGYLAPELFHPDGALYCTKNDIFSAGVVLICILRGGFPFKVENMRDLYEKNKNFHEHLHLESLTGVTEEARDLLSKLLSRDPDRRPTAKVALQHEWFAIHSSALRKQKKLIELLPTQIRTIREDNDISTSRRDESEVTRLITVGKSSVSQERKMSSDLRKEPKIKKSDKRGKSVRHLLNDPLANASSFKLTGSREGSRDGSYAALSSKLIINVDSQNMASFYKKPIDSPTSARKLEDSQAIQGTTTAKPSYFSTNRPKAHKKQESIDLHLASTGDENRIGKPSELMSRLHVMEKRFIPR
eukprot:TRINITY_DN5293_c0_g1_i1.p1 TRINITY_DN5293_c0_g1~~TRINITY_DN5293_c0_g1_i1.p1  ORF type:complete len:581 (+),score=80.60 TRINITY_DN5293_c0_g1_i1:73-1815(+)